MIRIKQHTAYRTIIAVSDMNLLGKKFVEGNLQLDLKESFYGGEVLKEEEAIELMKSAKADDVIFNIVGEESVSAGIKADIITKEGIITIKGIPHALGLL